MKQFNVHNEEFGVDMRWILESGHCLHSCEMIPLDRLLTDLFLSLIFLICEKILIPGISCSDYSKIMHFSKS